MREQIIVRDIVTTAEAAKAFRIAPSTINAWRQKNVGPPYFKLKVSFFTTAQSCGSGLRRAATNPRG